MAPKNIVHFTANLHARKVAPRRRVKQVFLHIPKCAGTSIASRLRHQYGPKSCWGHIDVRERYDDLLAYPHRLQRYRSYSGHFGPDFVDILEGPLFLFTFLRDPATRIVSAYNYTRASSPVGRKKLLIEQLQKMDFEMSLRSHAVEILKGTHNTMTWQLAFGYHHREVLSGIDDSELLERAKATLERMDFIGFYENLEEDFKRLQEALGIPVLPMPSKNITPDSYKQSVQAQLQSEHLEQHITLDRQLYEWARSRRKAT